MKCNNIINEIIVYCGENGELCYDCQKEKDAKGLNNRKKSSHNNDCRKVNKK